MANGDDFRGGSPWGAPPGGKNGSSRGGPKPPNIDEVVEKIQKLINKLIPGGKSGGAKPIIFGLILLVAVWAFSGLYRVLPDEQGVVLRFGKFVSTTQPGLNYHIPYPVETVLTPKVTKVNRIDIGFRSASDSGRSSGIGDVPETTPEPFTPPTAKPPITDDNGGIIEIPVDNPGSPWAEPPIVFVGGEGSGATAVGLLDGNGFLTEIRVRSSGFGYKLNRASDNDVRCIIDSFTILRPGIGYTSVPDMYVNGELGIAEAVIDPNTGFVIGARILNRELTFDRFPAVDIVGGGGYGARLLPSLACLDTDALSTIGSTKIGTGKYIDCP